MTRILTGKFCCAEPVGAAGDSELEMTDLHRTLRETDGVETVSQTVRSYWANQIITVRVREDCAGQVRRLMADLGMNVLG